MARRAAAFAGLLFSLMAFWQVACAAPVTDSDARAIHDVVQSQLDAFAEDDASRAFSFASHELQATIGNADRFLELVKKTYPPVYRNRMALYSAPERVDGHTLMIVRLTDADNSVWLAVYDMEREPDGRWSIGGCDLVETNVIAV